MAEKRPLKGSKSRKKWWKKNSSAKEVEEYLENKRFNARIGGSAAEKSDESLFVVEKSGCNDVFDDKSTEIVAKKDSKLNKIKSDLKYFKILESQSKVAPILARNAPKRQKRSFLNDDQKFTKLWPERREQYLRATEVSEKKRLLRSDPKLRFDFYDLWDQRPDPEPKDPEMEELIDYQSILKGSKPPKVPKHRYQKPSLLPAVEVPHSGQSYNPVFKDHQNLLALALDVEVVKKRDEERLNRIAEEYYVSKSEAPNDQTWALEMSHGLGLSDSEGEVQDVDTEGTEVIVSNHLVRYDNKKTKSQRRKELLQKRLKKEKSLEKSLKSKANDVFRVKSFKKELVRKEKESIERQKRRSERLIAKQYEPKRTSRLRYEKPDIELNLTEELAPSLRQMKAEGNLLDDRFKSIQRRNLVEVRARHVFKRKYKLKKVLKKSCKEPIV